MATFTIDSENNIVAHAGTPARADGQQAFATEKELAKLAADWPASRLIEVWNSFAGIAPFDDLMAVKKFTNADRCSAYLARSRAFICPLCAAGGTCAVVCPGRSINGPVGHTALSIVWLDILPY